MKEIKCFVVVIFILCFSFTGKAVRYDSYKGLVMAGYQGWFSAPTDGGDRGWYHYRGRNGFKPGSCSVDMWPDMSEYVKKYQTDFVFSDGSPACVFSSADESTVNLHFKWMKEYGIDGVFVQRFVSELKNEKSLRHLNKVFNSAIKASNQHERAISIMYDLSGMRSGDEALILDDLKKLTKEYGIKQRIKHPGYLFHNKKPLVSIWGVGFNDGRAYSLQDAEWIIRKLKENGYSVMLGVPTHWRTLSGDTSTDPKLHELIKMCDIVMPWFVGRYREEGIPKFKQNVKQDILWCKKNNVDYVPLAFPGFSWKNMKGQSETPTPRNRGSFFWKQLSGYIQSGAEMIYIAMFDEIDEGTAIFKCATEVPSGKSEFVALDKQQGSDYYLWLTGMAGKMLRKEIPMTDSMPYRKK